MQAAVVQTRTKLLPGAGYSSLRSDLTSTTTYRYYCTSGSTHTAKQPTISAFIHQSLPIVCAPVQRASLPLPRLESERLGNRTIAVIIDTPGINKLEAPQIRMRSPPFGVTSRMKWVGSRRQRQARREPAMDPASTINPAPEKNSGVCADSYPASFPSR